MATFAPTAWTGVGSVELDFGRPTPQVRAPIPARPVRSDAPASDRSLTAELERRGHLLSRRIAHDDLPTIDHLVVVPSGVWIVARKHVDCARVSVRRPRLTGRPTLRAGSRDLTAYVDFLTPQVTALRGHLFDFLDVPVQAALCLPGGEFPLLRLLSIDDHLIARPSQLLEHVGRKGPIKRTRCREVAAALDARLG